MSLAGVVVAHTAIEGSDRRGSNRGPVLLSEGWKNSFLLTNPTPRPPLRPIQMSGITLYHGFHNENLYWRAAGSSAVLYIHRHLMRPVPKSNSIAYLL